MMIITVIFKAAAVMFPEFIDIPFVIYWFHRNSFSYGYIFYHLSVNSAFRQR